MEKKGMTEVFNLDGGLKAWNGILVEASDERG
jgi:hypothetical protein